MRSLYDAFLFLIYLICYYSMKFLLFSGVAFGLVTSLAVLVSCAVFGAVAARRRKNGTIDDDEIKQDGSFPTLGTAPTDKASSYDLAALGASVLTDLGAPPPTHSKSENIHDVDVEKQQINDGEDDDDELLGTVPTVQRTHTLASISELVSNGSMDFGDVSMDTVEVSGDDCSNSEPHVQLVMNDNSIQSVPPPTPDSANVDTSWAAVGRTAAVLADQPGENSETDEASSVASNNIMQTGSTDFGVPSPPSTNTNGDTCSAGGERELCEEQDTLQMESWLW